MGPGRHGGKTAAPYWAKELARNECDVFAEESSGLDGLADPLATNPLQGAMDSEEIRRPLKLGVLARVWPRILLGMRIQWPVKRTKGQPCPGVVGVAFAVPRSAFSATEPAGRTPSRFRLSGDGSHRSGRSLFRIRAG